MFPFGLRTWKPNVVEPFAASVPLYDALRAVTVCPLEAITVFHDPVIVCPAGSVKVAVHALIDDALLFVTRTGSMT